MTQQTTDRTTATSIALELRGLSVAYGGVSALHGLSLRMDAGRIVTVIGPNGAGKTTLLSAAMGMLPSKGDVLLWGSPQRQAPIARRVRSGLMLVPESRELFGSMSVEDNLLLGAFTRYRQGERDQRQEMEAVFTRFPRLKERRTQFANTLSGGERAMLVLGRALMAKPRVLMLDEPSLGLAPLVVKEIFQIIANLRETGVAVLLVEQNARAALLVSDYAYVLENGRIAIEGPSHELKDDPRVMASYLGGS